MAGERHGLAPNPVAAARKARQRRRKLEQYLTAEEVEQLVAHAPSGQEAVLYEAAARTGLRWGELRPLRWGGVRFPDALIYVNRNWPVHGSEAEPKSGKARAQCRWMRRRGVAGSPQPARALHLRRRLRLLQRGRAGL